MDETQLTPEQLDNLRLLKTRQMLTTLTELRTTVERMARREPGNENIDAALRAIHAETREVAARLAAMEYARQE